MQEPNNPGIRGPAVSALAMGCLGTALAALGYGVAGASFNADEVVGPGIFWGAFVFFLLSVPLRNALTQFSVAIRSALGAGVFVLYITVHLILYGFLLDALLASFYGSSYFATGAGVYVTTNLFSPPSLAGLASDLAYNPVIAIAAPPIFSTALSFYSVAAAVTIAVLVVANIGRTRELGSSGAFAGRTRSFVVLPVVGIVFGASCCLSVAGLISLVSPAGTLLTSNPWIYYTTYFLFPSIAVVLLYLNLRSMRNGLPGTSA